MRKIEMFFPDGVAHSISIINALEVLNLGTGREEVIVDYVDHTLHDEEGFSAIINVLGEWVKNPESKNCRDMLMLGDLGDSFIDNLPDTLKCFNEEDRIFGKDTAKYYYATRLSTHIQNKIEQNTDFMKDNEVRVLLMDLVYAMVSAYSTFFNTAGRCEWEICKKIEDDFLKRLDLSLEDVDILKNTINYMVEVYQNLSSGYSVTARYQAMSNIYRRLCRIEEANHTMSYVSAIFKLLKIELYDLDKDEYVSYIGELLELVTAVEKDPSDSNVLELISKIDDIVNKYKKGKINEFKRLKLVNEDESK